MKIFSARLKILRDTLSQNEFAKSLNIPQTTYSRYETGKNEPDYESLVLICRRCGVSSDWLLGLSDERAQRSGGVSVVGDSNAVASAPHARVTAARSAAPLPCPECARKDEIIRNLSATLAALTKGR